MIQFLETPVGKIILMVIVGLIWGLNVINFSNMAQEEQVGSISAELELIDVMVPNSYTYSYTKSNRDPFIRGNIPMETPPPEIQLEPIISKQLPNIKLVGVMGSISILQLENGETVMKKEGEQIIMGILLERVYEDSVSIQVNDESITLTLH